MIVTVVIPTYNYAATIIRAIDSVLAAAAAFETEIIVVDDGSTDNTAERLQPYINQKRIRYCYQDNRGKAAATKKGIDLASGEFFFNLDADDYFLPEKIKETVSVFAQYKDVVHVASAALMVTSEDVDNAVCEQLPDGWTNQPVEGNKLLQYFYDRNMLYGGGSTFAARTILLKNILLPKGVDMYVDEWLVIQALLNGKSYLFSKPLSVWAIHGSNYSVGNLDAVAIKKRQQRLLDASKVVLNLLGKLEVADWLIKAYKIKHTERVLLAKEQIGTKGLKDILLLIKLLPGANLQQIKSYHLVQRLLPTTWLNFLKKYR